ncbi:hypothetical protein M758_8G168900 [Ceratodon purpureus]|nr:hypothetical protein M758_8G168900 [Ceratodon purpureus]
MEDREGMKRLRRNDRRLLPPQVGRKGVEDVVDEDTGRENADLARRTRCEQLTFLDGRKKYVCAAFANHDWDEVPLMRTANYTEYGTLRAGRRKGRTGLSMLLEVFAGKNEKGRRDGGSGRGSVVVGCLATAVRIGVLLLSRSLCEGAWPVLQALSLCTVPFGALKQLALPEPARSIIEPIAGPVLGITVAQPIVWLCLPNVYRTLKFWKRLLPIYFRYIKTKRQVRKMTSAQRDEVWAVRHEWGGEKVHSLVLDMSGFYVKSAQILATKADFVPEPWIRRLSNHLDNAPPRPFAEVQRSIMQQLATCPRSKSLSVGAGGLVPLEEVFLEVDSTALAAASIAQVHAGTLKDNSRVVIKVQHLGMQKVMAADLRNIGWVANFLQGQLPFDLVPIVKEIQATIPLEFDFNREVWFMTNIRRSLKEGGFDRIKCPEPILDLCSGRLIVMERLDGVPFTQILHSRAPAALQRRIPEVVRALEVLVHSYGQMLFIDGVFHADPHAGNLLLLSDGRLGLIDFGQSKVLDKEMRLKLARMITALASDEEARIARALINLGLRFEDVNGGEVSENRLAIMARILFDTCYVQEATVSPMSQDSILRTTPLKAFNQSVWMVVRALVILRGLCFALKMDLSATAIWFPYARDALAAAGET